MLPATSLQKLTIKLLTLAIVIVCCIRDGSTAPSCTKTYVSATLEEADANNPTPLTVLDVASICTLVASDIVSLSGDDSQFDYDTSAKQLKCKTCDAEARLSTNPSVYANPWTIILKITDAEGNFTLVTVFVKLTSINDFPADSSDLNGTVGIPESTAVGTVIRVCSLQDGDYPGSGHDVPYVQITSGNDDNKFAVDSRTCEIRLIDSLNAVTKNSYTLIFTTYNFENDKNVKTHTVTVNVTPDLIYPPKCTPSNIILGVPEDKAINSVLTTLNCTNIDGSTNVQYYRDASSSITELDVNQQTGDVSLISSLQYSNVPANNVKQITVIVTPQGRQNLRTKATVKVIVLGTDKYKAIMMPTSFSTKISTNTLNGALVLNVTATYQDIPNTFNSKITYVLDTPCSPDWLVLDGSRGSIYVSGALTPNTITCKISAYSSNKTTDKTTANVSITVFNDTNNPPAFSKFLYIGNVTENSNGGNLVLNVKATDPDVGGTIKYSFPSGTNWPFAVDPLSGSVTVAYPIDYEVHSDPYSGPVTATDSSTPPMTAVAYVTIYVLPENEYKPVFQPTRDANINRLEKPGTRITKITADDKDAGQDGIVQYYLQNTSLPFVLDRQTGTLFVGVGLDKVKAQILYVVITATDMSTIKPMTSTTTVTVNIKTNTNNYDPQCSPLGPLLVMPNAPSIGNPIGYLQCTDDDLTTLFSFDIIEGDPHTLFETTYNGTIRLKTTPIEGLYIVKVRVSDQGSPERTTIVSVQINVQTNLVFSNLPNSTSVFENTNITDVIFTVVAKGSYEQMKYEITGGNSLGIFNIHPTTGVLRVVRYLDRETNDFYNLEVSASASGKTIKQNLSITVLDKNDNYPRYISSLSYIQISESQPVFSSIAMYSASDADIHENAEIDYIILSGDTSMFRYDKSGQIILLNKLDYKNNLFFTFNLCARDRGTPPLNTTMILNIQVVPDSNNNLVIVPSGGRIPLTLPENTTIGSALIKISLQNNESSCDITFTITSGNDANNFSIGQKTGIVYLTYALDREYADSMIIGIQVNNTNGKINFTTVAINITDSNDNAPVCNPSNNIFYVQGSSVVGTSVGTLVVTDRDIGVNSNIVLSIISGDTNGQFRFDGKTLKVASRLDPQVKNRYDLTSLAADQGVPSLNSSCYVTVFVKPEFNKPQFAPKNGSVSVVETVIPGTLLYNADATVAGATEHTSTNPGDLVYALSSGDRAKFYIEYDIGIIRLTSKLNYTLNKSFILVITASNKYNLSLSDNFTLTIIVTQVNRYDPVCTSDIFVWYVDEIIGLGTIVGRVTATDLDHGEFGVLRYEVESNIYFAINSSTGALSLIHTLDYSTAKSHNLLVTVTDNAGIGSRNAFCLVVIYVVDWNNHYPSFMNVPYEVTVPETLPVGTTILVVYTEDADSGVNGTVICSIISGNSNGIFKLEPISGALSLSSSLDYENFRQHVMIVEANDGGKPPNSNRTIVTVKVKDENDHVPDFGTSRIDITIRSDTPPLTPIYKCMAKDGDSGKNGIVNYAIESGNSDNLFMIDTDSGVVKTATYVATANSFQLMTVVAIDEGETSKTGSVLFAVTIQPAQKPLPGNYDFTVQENSPVGTQVGTISNDTSITAYIISGGNSGSTFEITKKGIIRVSKQPDRELYPFFQLLISVVTSLTSSYVTVNIEVTDVNDNAPVIVKSVLRIQVVENLAAGNVVGSFNVTDADEKGKNSEYDLFISPARRPAITYFSIDALGTLRLLRPISYEVLSSLEFYVVARDRGSPPLSSAALVYVDVVDVNEEKNYNYFQSAFFTSCNFPDDAIEGEVVCQLTPVNVNVTVGSGDIVRYTIVGKDSIFSVHSSTGYLQVSKKSFITQVTRYIQWIVVTVKSGGVTTDYALMVRLDTFNKKKHLISVKVGIDQENLQTVLKNLQANLQSLFSSPKHVAVWNTRSTVSSNSRRRLLASESEALVIVENDNAINDVSNIDVAKTFMTSEEAMKVLQQSSDGTPKPSLASSTPAVISVKPYSTSDDSLDPAYIALIVVGSIFVLALIIAIIVLIIYCCCYRRAKDQDKKQLVRKQTKSQQTFGNINKSKKMKTQSQQTIENVQMSKETRVKPETFVNKSNPNDPDSDGMPVRPTTAMFISSHTTPINVSDSKPKINSSTMLESLEEKSEEEINNNASIA